MAKKSGFIQSAVKHPGSLTREAKAAGKSIGAFCAQSNLTTHQKRQCALAKTLSQLRKKS